ncbi:hypothetical protein J5N97_018842 [Dioscorea zingiberensis]|uniref:Uncharacterized protein n=1 Tax=Dioscorea zingiberensis TaxID=325984 RepID=A0A9D5CDS6_9LILI|nr:hypothetical protein J5N97_018842 [Dioscorea zingiberensis]
MRIEGGERGKQEKVARRPKRRKRKARVIGIGEGKRNWGLLKPCESSRFCDLFLSLGIFIGWKLCFKEKEVTSWNSSLRPKMLE